MWSVVCIVSDKRVSYSLVEGELPEAEFTGSRRECLAYIRYRVRQKLKNFGIVSAAKPTRRLQAFAVSGFSRLLRFYIKLIRVAQSFIWGIPPDPRATQDKPIRMFRCARSGCRTPPPRILHLLRSTYLPFS
jgi:hypothetical protein